MSRITAAATRSLSHTTGASGTGPWAVGALVLALAAILPARAAGLYYPGPGEQWQKRAPDAVGMDADKVAEAVRFAQTHEVNWARQLQAQITAAEHRQGRQRYDAGIYLV